MNIDFFIENKYKEKAKRSNRMHRDFHANEVNVNARTVKQLECKDRGVFKTKLLPKVDVSFGDFL